MDPVSDQARSMESRQAGARTARRATAGFFILLAAAAPFFSTDYYLYTLALLLIQAIAVISLGYVIWNTELVSVGHAAIQGVGAYVAALMITQMGADYVTALIVGCVAAALIGLIVAAASVRVKGPYFAVITLGLAWSVPEVILVYPELTGGFEGISIPDAALFGLHGQTVIYYVALVVLIASVIMLYRLDRARFGRALLMVRDNELASRTLGISPPLMKILAITFSNVLAGLSGVLLLYMVTTVSPSNFSFTQSIFFLAAAIIGGTSTPIGGIIGAVFIVLVPQLLSDFSALTNIIMGVILFVFLTFAPHGLAPILRKGLDRAGAAFLSNRGRPE